ncbi:class I SAM-dependent methyltransferase [Mycoplana rhizolycopersici]|uniref:Class I SAM-dependent methyltransferase n=1 Tax=Mycoplana rhizolycopersici TaxID=2746702 RepID=A0ABX2QGD0_9HYPH|nr:class I SAM-dependent methyltransferase [Rhizobium rhizolycopersici]NVP56829.1 class I SAM-dependent methyltransferase [Rhizobium rhizolycopersici]
MSIVEKLLQDRPSFHMGGDARWDCTVGMLRYIRDKVKPTDRTLEVGCGVSTVVFASIGCDHTVLSPDPREHERVLAYCDANGIDRSRLKFAVGFSDDVLPDLCKDRSLDVAFIDGAHHFPYPLVDWHYVTRALKVGGCLLLDDIPIPAVSVAYRFMRTDPAWRLEEVLDSRAAVFTLLTEPGQQDWTEQAFCRRMDYSFAPMPTRVALQVGDEVRRVRKSVGRRYPSLRRLLVKQKAIQGQ